MTSPLASDLNSGSCLGFKRRKKMRRRRKTERRKKRKAGRKRRKKAKKKRRKKAERKRRKGGNIGLGHKLSVAGSLLE